MFPEHIEISVCNLGFAARSLESRIIHQMSLQEILLVMEAIQPQQCAENNVKDSSFYGLVKGTARGGAPSIIQATYKVCSPLGCSSEAMLATFDNAIFYGVDIITISEGSSTLERFEVDLIVLCRWLLIQGVIIQRGLV